MDYDIRQQFIMVEKLGIGKYGDVWKVKRISDGEFYALKLIFSYDGLISPTISNEVSMMRKISAIKDSEQYFPHVIDTFKFKSFFGILMEFVEGISLFKYFENLQKNNEAIDPKTLKRLMKHIFKALNILHINGIAHRDIKDENIIINKDEIKIIDFGFTCYFDVNSENYQPLNIECCVLGTPAFMAPEIWANEGEKNPFVYPKSDIWSAGLVFWELISLEDPPDVDVFDKRIKIIQKYDAKKLENYILKRSSTELVNTTEKLRNIILLCVKTKPCDRPTADELLKMLKNDNLFYDKYHSIFTTK